ncbi:tellurite resistance protein [Corynebacterium macginleyi]|uniref:TDT family transporter n=2 Tax=Corynebacterium macginleyi TaxID=38290 RepID=A0ABS1Y7Q5_9CORY|nr:tellurite resistance protein [Corynebacterium macginleyi]MBM0244428.1 TDT family transporter [Corynebacterium macginleyi]
MFKVRNDMKIPPLGPGWAGALMGLSISSSLIDTHFGPVMGRLPAEIMLGVANLVFLALTAGFIKYRTPGFRFEDMPAWGMASMGILAIGSAYSLICDAWLIHTVCWAGGTILSVITCLKYLTFLFSDHPSNPTFIWGLPLVAPMVSATSSAQLVPHAGEWGSLVHGVGVFCFVLAWVAGMPMFTLIYLRTFPKPPLNFAATAWIPMGLVGQSTAAAQLLAGDQWHFRAMVYGVAMLGLGVPLSLYAITKHWCAALGNTPMSYNPSWWASTFPVGTCCLGTHTLSTQPAALAWGLGWMDTVSAALLVLLLLHVTWAAFGAIKTVSEHFKVSHLSHA